MNFEELVNNINPKIKAIAHRLDGKYTMFNDEDLCQEALLHLWEKFNKGELEDKTASFIIQGCSFNMRNYIRTHFKGVDRKSISAYEQINEEGDVLMDLIADKKKSDLDEYVNTRALVDDLMANLGERARAVLAMSRQGMTTREIGRKLGVSHVMVVKIKKKVIRAYRMVAPAE